MEQILIFQKIIEQESKTSTYKFALLRALIDIISAQSPHIEVRANQVAIPIQLITDKWLFYYWDLIEKDFLQISGERNLVFKKEMIVNKKKFTNFWTFQKEFHKHPFSPSFKKDFILLSRKMNKTIKDNPMKYIGSSIFKSEYSLFLTESGNILRSDSIQGYLDLLSSSPKLLMEKSYFETLKLFGGLLSGTNSIIMNWVDFMDNQKKRPIIKKTKVVGEKQVIYDIKKQKRTPLTPLQILLQSETVIRDTSEIRNFWINRINSGEKVFCTWSGKLIKETDDLAIDHAIPFSVLFNNDFWNLMPADKKVNGQKTDFILSEIQIQKSTKHILEAWDAYQKDQMLKDIFQAQCQISLSKANDYKPEILLRKFSEINQGFINLRGMESWEWGKNSIKDSDSYQL